MDSKEYYAPIITPYEAQLAFTPGAEWGQGYDLGFDGLLRETDCPIGVEKMVEPSSSFSTQPHDSNSSQSLPESPGTALCLSEARTLAKINDEDKHLVEVGNPLS